MSIDLRVKHDLESRRRAVELFDAGVGCKPAAEALSVPRETVREWQWVYRAFGSEALLSMGGKHSRYTFEQRVAAASAVRASRRCSMAPTWGAFRTWGVVAMRSSRASPSGRRPKASCSQKRGVKHSERDT